MKPYPKGYKPRSAQIKDHQQFAKLMLSNNGMFFMPMKERNIEAIYHLLNAEYLKTATWKEVKPFNFKMLPNERH